MFPYVVKTEYYDEDISGYKKLNCLLYADNFYDVCERIIKYCDPDHIEIDCVGDEFQLFEVTEDIANALIKGSGVYEDGIELENAELG